MGAYDRDLPLLNPRKVARGKYGRVYDSDGNYLDNVTEFEAKVKFNKKKVDRGNAFLEANRIVGGSGSGKMKIYKTDSKLMRKIAENPDETVDLLGELQDVDPMTSGANYRVMIKGILFDETELHAFKVGDLVEGDLAFTFDDYEYL